MSHSIQGILFGFLILECDGFALVQYLGACRVFLKPNLCAKQVLRQLDTRVRVLG